MPFKSKAQIAKLSELVDQGKMSKAKFDEWMSETASPDALPERLSSTQQRPNQTLASLVRKGRMAKVIK